MLADVPARPALPASAFSTVSQQPWPSLSPADTPAEACSRAASATLPAAGMAAVELADGGSLAPSEGASASPMPQQRSMSRQGSLGGVLNRRPSSQAQGLWRASSAVSDRAFELGLQSIRCLCGESYIPPERLRKPKPLGEGAYAVVETAQLLPAEGSDWPSGERGERTVAVKRLKPHVLESEDDVVAFIQEARLLTRLRHPSVVEFIGLGAADTSSREAQWRTMFLVQEYASGGTLKRLVLAQMIDPRRKLYSLGDAVLWGTQVAQGLAYLHGLRPMIVHRDLKSENVLLARTRPGEPPHAKIADFGLHKLVHGRAQRGFADIKEEGSHHGCGEAALRLHANSSKLSVDLGGDEEASKYDMTGQTGAFVYMAPEVLLGTAYNEKVDVFSFGVVLYELLHRKMIIADLMHLGSAEDAEAFAYRVAAGYRLPISEEVPGPLAQLVAECWAGKPEQRPSMAEVVQRLEAVAQSGELEAHEHLHGPSGGTAACCAVM